MDRSRFTVNCSIIFTELPVLERAAAARAAGFSAVEFWWPFPDGVPPRDDVDAFVDSIEKAGVVLSGLNFFAGNMPAGERGILSSPDREREFVDNKEVVRHLVDATGCRMFNVLYGLRLPDQDAAAQDAVAIDRLAALAPFTAESRSTILIEPLSALDHYPIRTAADAIEVVEKVGATGAGTTVAVLADLYHLATNGQDVPASIDELGPMIGHVQIADVPGRGAPGSGTAPVSEWFAALDAVGYDGRIGLEYAPGGPSAESFGWIDTLG